MPPIHYFPFEKKRISRYDIEMHLSRMYILNQKEILMNYYIQTEANGQLKFSDTISNYLMIPSFLTGFNNTTTSLETTASRRTIFRFHGSLEEGAFTRICPDCGRLMHINNHPEITLHHLPFGSSLSCVTLTRTQYLCPECNKALMPAISFKAAGHRITCELEQYTKDLLATGKYTLKQVGEITGLGKNTVKSIDLQRLKELYTIDGEKLTRPEDTARYLGIDEFKLHNGYRYATHIIDMETGHILWIAHGKKKQVVYDFIDHVGLEWMDHVEAIACDMNSDFQEAFEEKCPHIQPVFDYFHIVKNFNEKVVAEVRKDEQRRLLQEGNDEAARALKKTRYILTSSRDTLQRKDQEARDGKIISKGSALFGTESVTRKEGYEAKYDELLRENRLLFTVDLVKEKVALAYSLYDEARMAEGIIEIIDLCDATGNKHLQWFGRLLSSHFEGIIAHATYRISAGKIEGINNKIKTMRRQGYGYPDDEYFFLKLFDISRQDYVRNPASHRKSD